MAGATRGSISRLLGSRSPIPGNELSLPGLPPGFFFPQRLGLRLTPHRYSPSILDKIVRPSALEPWFQEAVEALEELADVAISGRQADRIAHEVGQQLQADRDHH